MQNNLGEFQGRVYLAPMKPGNLQVNLPEVNVLLDKSKRSVEAVPDYNALVCLKRLD
ncbi:MAG: hypothetical protein F6K18_30755 [Okeania sp. SIO2C2]|uniref:hypothetical protein n=1 Tax=Okeania sp. SIO2C2 TaxID=2607787 RepID=UPI0013BB0C70|nr:hypothetical protein [Okeania sp. SIO2C2]NEP90837.1 hypothetical protein [Okeania sp. SIO2C2]